MPRPDASKYHFKTVANALEVLKEFTADTPWLGASEISRRMDLNRATAHYLLQTLAEHGFLEQDPESRKYSLGLSVVALAGSKLAQMDLADIAQPHLTKLMHETDETVHLAVLYQSEVLYLAKIETPNTLRVTSHIGGRGPLHCSATGKVLLAYLSEEERTRLLAVPLKAYTSRTITDRARLRRELALVKGRGYSIDDEGYVPHLRSIAAPILNRHGAAVAAVALGGPSARVTYKAIEKFVPLLLNTTSAISRRYLELHR